MEEIEKCVVTLAQKAANSPNPGDAVQYANAAAQVARACGDIVIAKMRHHGSNI
jgi:hypothetical protein